MEYKIYTYIYINKKLSFLVQFLLQDFKSSLHMSLIALVTLATSKKAANIHWHSAKSLLPQRKRRSWNP